MGTYRVNGRIYCRNDGNRWINDFSYWNESTRYYPYSCCKPLTWNSRCSNDCYGHLLLELNHSICTRYFLKPLLKNRRGQSVEKGVFFRYTFCFLWFL